VECARSVRDNRVAKTFRLAYVYLEVAHGVLIASAAVADAGPRHSSSASTS
jgi:hypothetical protein